MGKIAIAVSQKRLEEGSHSDFILTSDVSPGCEDDLSTRGDLLLERPLKGVSWLTLRLSLFLPPNSEVKLLSTLPRRGIFVRGGELTASSPVEAVTSLSGEKVPRLLLTFSPVYWLLVEGDISTPCPLALELLRSTGTELAD
jgi:hypothetical protein